MKRIGYMGCNEQLILELLDNKNCKLNFVITQENRISNTMFKLLSVINIPYYIVRNKKDLLQYGNLYEEVDFILAHRFGIIIPDNIIQKYKCFNIHSGDLKTNRGAYPLVRNILNDDNEAVLTLHKIGKEIDTGEVIGKYKIPITKEDTNVTLKEKLNGGLGKLVNDLIRYDEKKVYEIIKEGIYYKKVNEEEILKKDSDGYEEINKKIRAQKSYGGALAKYKEYLVRISEIIS